MNRICVYIYFFHVANADGVLGRRWDSGEGSEWVVCSGRYPSSSQYSDGGPASRQEMTNTLRVSTDHCSRPAPISGVCNNRDLSSTQCTHVMLTCLCQSMTGVTMVRAGGWTSLTEVVYGEARLG